MSDYSGRANRFEHPAGQNCEKPYPWLLLPGKMKLVRDIKSAVGRRMLSGESEPERETRGSNFNTAEKVGLIYLDEDENSYKKVKNFLRELKEQFPVKSVKALGFIDNVSKHVPVYQSHKLELEYFTRDELNWYLKPIRNISTFVQDDFDILIDLSGGNVLPLNYIMKLSKARMKIAPKNTGSAAYCDLVIDMGHETSLEKFLEQLRNYLSNSKIK